MLFAALFTYIWLMYGYKFQSQVRCVVQIQTIYLEKKMLVIFRITFNPNTLGKTMFHWAIPVAPNQFPMHPSQRNLLGSYPFLCPVPDRR